MVSTYTYTYYTLAGERRTTDSLDVMCRNAPEWAAARLRIYEDVCLAAGRLVDGLDRGSLEKVTLRSLERLEAELVR